MARTFTRAFTDKDGRRGVHFLAGCTLAERNTPWGAADTATTHAEGIVSYSTPSHGGFHLSPERLTAIPAEVLICTFNQQGERGWFEEDEDWALVAAAFPEAFTATDCALARDLLSDETHDRGIAFWTRAWHENPIGQNKALAAGFVAKLRARKAALARWNPPGLRPAALAVPA